MSSITVAKQAGRPGEGRGEVGQVLAGLVEEEHVRELDHTEHEDLGRKQDEQAPCRERAADEPEARTPPPRLLGEPRGDQCGEEDDQLCRDHGEEQAFGGHDEGGDALREVAGPEVELAAEGEHADVRADADGGADLRADEGEE